jgi:hypothetical protein
LEEDELRQRGTSSRFWFGFGVTTDHKVARREACTPAVDAPCTGIFARTVAAAGLARAVGRLFPREAVETVVGSLGLRAREHILSRVTCTCM